MPGQDFGRLPRGNIKIFGMPDNKPKATGAGASPPTKVTSLATTTDNPSKNRPSCTYCKLDNHELERCFKFRDKSYEERKNFIRKEKFCDNWLQVNHQARRCKRARACLFIGCTEQHHSLLHPPTPRDGPSDTPERNDTGDRPGQSTGAGSEGNCAAIGSDRPRVNLRIVPVRVSGVEGGRKVETYAFLDDRLNTTLCLNSLVEELGLSGPPINYMLTTVNAESEARLSCEIQLNVNALKTNSGIRLDRVWTVDSLPISQRSIPSTEDVKKWSHLQDIELPKLDGKSVTLLIGNDVPEAHWTFEQRRGRRKQPYAARTLLGWTLIGPIGEAGGPVSTSFLGTKKQPSTQ